MRARLPLLFCILLGTAPRAQVRTGGPYAAALEGHVAGGGASASAHYASLTSLGGPAGLNQGSAQPTAHRGGYTGQVSTPASLTLLATPATVDESDTRAVSVTANMDDATFRSLNPSEAAWAVSFGPLASVNPAGVVTAGSVYTDTPAGLAATWQGAGGTLALTVLNTRPDNFGSYAGDAVPDDWQVTHFGLGNPLGLASQDPDGDGQDNLFEYLAGVAPTNAASRFVFQIAPVPGQPARKALSFTPWLADRTYSVQRRDALETSAWVPFPSATNTVGQTRTVTDLNDGGDRQYYRVGIQKP